MKIILSVFLFITILTFLIPFNSVLESDKYIYFSKDTNFEDLTKLTMSYNNIFSKNDLLQIDVPATWINSNPYNNLVQENVLYGYQAPPLYVIQTQVLGYLLKYSNLSYLKVTFLLSSIIYFFYLKKVLQQLINKIDTIFLPIILFCYPILFIFQRGNLNSLFMALIFANLFDKFINEKDFRKIDYIYFILVSSLRPQFLIFCLIFVEKTKLKKSFYLVINILINFIFANFIFMFIASKIYPGYKWSTFALGLRSYALSQLPGNGFDSSTFKTLLSLLNEESLNVDFIFFHIQKFLLFQTIILFIYLIFTLYIFNLFLKSEIDKIQLLTIITSIYIVSSHPIGDYHLIILVMVLIILLKNYSKKYIFLVLCILIVVTLKPHSTSISFFNYSLIINNLVLNFIIFERFVLKILNIKLND